MGKFSRIIKVNLQQLRWWGISQWWINKLPVPHTGPLQTQYSIGLVTYIKRYDIHFKPLIKQLCYLFPDTEINVAVNGYYDQEQQQAYLKDIKDHVSQYPNVKLISYAEGQSLSKLWNQLIIHSTSPKTFIFNDDIKLAKNFRHQIEGSGILKEQVAIINASWSHFLISRSAAKAYGWFDERFPGVGYEDHDFEIRLKIAGLEIKSFAIKDLKNLSYATKDFSWGANERTIFEKYSGVNGDHYFAKWDISEKEQEGFTFVRIIRGYAKIKPDMETPDFYPDFQP